MAIFAPHKTPTITQKRNFCTYFHNLLCLFVIHYFFTYSRRNTTKRRETQHFGYQQMQKESNETQANTAVQPYPQQTKREKKTRKNTKNRKKTLQNKYSLISPTIQITAQPTKQPKNTAKNTPDRKTQPKLRKFTKLDKRLKLRKIGKVRKNTTNVKYHLER